MSIQELEILIKSLVLTSKNGLSIRILNKQYQEEVGYSIPFNKYGYDSLESFLSSLGKSVTVHRNGGDIIVKAVSSSKTKHIEEMVSAQENKRRSRHIRHRSITCRFYPNTPVNSDSYKKKNDMVQSSSSVYFKSQRFSNLDKINSRKVNYIDNEQRTENSVENEQIMQGNKVIENLNNSRIQMSYDPIDQFYRIQNEEQKKLYEISSNFDRKQYKKDDIHCNIKSASYQSDTKISKSDINTETSNSGKSEYMKKIEIKKTPFEVSKGHKIKTQEDRRQLLLNTMFTRTYSNSEQNESRNFDYILESVALVGDKFPPANICQQMFDDIFCINISEIHNPYKIWFHVEENLKNLINLTNAIKLFYEKQEHNYYKMNISYMKPKQICIVKYDEEWYRAQILEQPVDNTVKVYLVDYGNIEYLLTSYIYYIHKDFIKNPIYVFRGCLSYVKPLDLKWRRECTEFLKSVFDKKEVLWCKVVDFDEYEDVFIFTLVDISGENEININECLIKKGFAEIFKDYKDVKCYYQYNYPTFDMLESGEYATYKEIGDMLKQNYNYEKEKYKTLGSINSQKLYGLSTIEFWNFLRLL